MDLNIKCRGVQIDSWSNSSIDLTIEKASEDEILDHFTEVDIVSHFDKHKLLDEIGAQECMDYFDLIEIKYEKE